MLLARHLYGFIDMALVKQDFQALLGTGIETNQDPKLVQLGKLLVCENSNLNKKDGSSYLRNGNDSLSLNTFDEANVEPDAGTLINVQKLATINNELVAINNRSIYGWSEDTEKWHWKGFLGNVLAKSTQVYREAATVLNCDSIVNNNIVVTSSIPGTNGSTTGAYVAITIMDNDTKKVLLQVKPQSVGVDLNPDYYYTKCAKKDDYIYVFYGRKPSAVGGTDYLIDVTRIDTNTLDLVTDRDISGSGLYYSHFDVTNINGQLVLAGTRPSASSEITLTYLTDAGAFGGTADGLPANTLTITTTAARFVVSLCGVDDGTNEKIYIFGSGNFGTDREVETFIYDLDFTNQQTNTLTVDTNEVVRSIVSIAKEDKSYVFFTTTKSITSIIGYSTYSYSLDDSNAVDEYCRRLFNCSVYTKPFYDNLGEMHIAMVNSGCGVEQKSVIVCRVNEIYSIDTDRELFYDFKLYPVCQFAVNEGLDEALEQNSKLSHEISLLGNVASFASQRAFAISSAERTAMATEIAELHINTNEGYITIAKENTLYISGGLLFNYDGYQVTEQNFLWYPRILDITDAAAGGISDAETYSWVSTYEWTDRNGDRHMSAPSLTDSEPIAANRRADLDILNMSLTYKENVTAVRISDLGIYVYRNNGTGTTRYKNIPSSPELQNNDFNQWENTYLDNTDNADLIQQEIVYTNGGVLSSVSSGSSGSIEDYQGRILLSNRYDSNTTLFSKQKQKYLAFQFNPDLEFKVLEEDSRIYASKTLDDKLILFKESSIHIQVGQGPSDTGENSDYLQNPQRISSNVGCPYPRSIVRFDKGLIFKSKDGFYLLDRSLGLTPIGKPVDYFKNKTVTDAVLLEDRDEIRWVHSDGPCLVYNYYQDQWFVYTNHEANSCTIWNDKFVIAKTNGEIWVENKSSNLDNGEAYQRRIVTPWIALAGLQHAQRIYRIKLLGEMRSRHTVTAYLAYDYEPARREEFTWDSFTEIGDVSLSDDAYYDTPPTYTNQDRTYDLEFRPAIQKCEAFRIELIDDADLEEGSPVDGGRAVWTSLTMTVGAKKSTLRSSTNRRTDPT